MSVLKLFNNSVSKFASSILIGFEKNEVAASPFDFMLLAIKNCKDFLLTNLPFSSLMPVKFFLTIHLSNALAGGCLVVYLNGLLLRFQSIL